MRLVWPLSSVGKMHVHFDRIRVAVPLPKAELLASLPVARLKAAAHFFEVQEKHKFNHDYMANIELVCAGTDEPLRILSQSENSLGTYSVTQVEVSGDIVIWPHRKGSMPKWQETNAILRGEEHLLLFVRYLLKRNAHRGIVIPSYRLSKQKPLPKGLVDSVTFYYEGSKSTNRLKIYLRWKKLPAGQFGPLILRAEWTLRTPAALTRHLGGKDLRALLRADLEAFVRRQVVVAEVDHLKLGTLLMPSRRLIRLTSAARSHLGWKPASYWIQQYPRRRARSAAARSLDERKTRVAKESREAARVFESERAWRWERAAHESPTRYLHEVRKAQRKEERELASKKRASRARRKPRITDHRIAKAFPPPRKGGK